MGSAGAAGAASTAAAPPAHPGLRGLRLEAAHLAALVQERGIQLADLSERYDAAELHSSQLAAAITTLDRQLATTTAAAAADRTILRDQAVAAYVTGGDPPAEAVGGNPQTDPDLILAYAGIVAGQEHAAVVGLTTLQARQVAEAAVLDGERRAARAALTTLAAARTSAEHAAALEAATLRRVRGRVAVLVAADERRQQMAEAAAIKRSLGSVMSLGPTTTTTARPTSPFAPTTTTTTVAPSPPAATPTTTTVPSSPTTPVTGPATTTTTSVMGSSPLPTPVTGAAAAIAYAEAQIGKPYQWGGAGPATFDCSGLVMEAWLRGGVSFPHLAQDQYDLTARVLIPDLQPGDLVFFGTPTDVYHVGIYIGNGEMVDAPETGQDVQIDSIFWTGLLGGGRVT